MLDAARCFALVPCAGVGLRAGTSGPKQYALLAGQPVVAYTLQALAAVQGISATLVVLAPEDAQFEQQVPAFAGPRAWVARCGGSSRAATVAAGLNELQRRGALAQDWVLVHDAARCLLQPDWVQRLIDACLGDGVGGLLALPLADTLKEQAASPARALEAGNGSNRQDGQEGQDRPDVPTDPSRPDATSSQSATQPARVACSVPRANKWLAQTPQMFPLGLLQQALREASTGADLAAVTDEASAIEALGLAPLLVPGELENFKLTWPADFALAARLLESR
jgi:2-C-methyl-D-erythritol 4-phosphate cytidylyltransferase